MSKPKPKAKKPMFEMDVSEMKSESHFGKIHEGLAFKPNNSKSKNCRCRWSCETCLYWSGYAFEGLCTIDPPNIKASSSEKYEYTQPTTHKDQYCWKHKSK